MTISSTSPQRTASPPLPPHDFDALYRNHERQLRLWLRNRLRDSVVDDVSQEVWLRISRAYRDQFDGRNFRAWMFQIARNCVVTFQRKRKDMASLDEDGIPMRDVRDDEAITILINRERRHRLKDCMTRLGHPRRAIVESRLAGSAYEDCAAAIGLTKQEAYSHFFAAKNLLRTCMQSKQPRSR
jgi:RNA polymerase sigma-70 factor (ECF subfamily)